VPNSSTTEEWSIEADDTQYFLLPRDNSDCECWLLQQPEPKLLRVSRRHACLAAPRDFGWAPAALPVFGRERAD
jgi:hypothetical protein